MTEQPARQVRKGSSGENRMVPGSARETELKARNRAQALRGAIDFHVSTDGRPDRAELLMTADVFLSWLEKP